MNKLYAKEVWPGTKCPILFEETGNVDKLGYGCHNGPVIQLLTCIKQDWRMADPQDSRHEKGYGCCKRGPWHMQRPDYGNWQSDECRVGDDVGDTNVLVERTLPHVRSEDRNRTK